jgi:uncharacterized membrane protein YidH (DUF202 family)
MKISVCRRQKIFGPYTLRVISGGANMDIDRQEQKKDELIYDILKSEYADEVKKSDRIDEEARGLVPNILIVVAILLGAGTTSLFVDVMSVHQSHFPILYALGISFMIISITLVFVILKFLGGMGLSDTGKYFSNNQAVDYEHILKDNILTLKQRIINTREKNQRKQSLVILMWLFLIVGLVIIMVLIVFLLLSN